MPTSSEQKQTRVYIRNLILFNAAVACIGLLLLFAAFHEIGIPCLIYKFTGLRCPGCGNTRAVVALFSLDIMKALSYNLLFPLEFLYLGWVYVYSCHSYLKTKRVSITQPFRFIDIAVIAAVGIWVIVRNLLHI